MQCTLVLLAEPARNQKVCTSEPPNEMTGGPSQPAAYQAGLVAHKGTWPLHLQAARHQDNSSSMSAHLLLVHGGQLQVDLKSLLQGLPKPLQYNPPAQGVQWPTAEST